MKIPNEINKVHDVACSISPRHTLKTYRLINKKLRKPQSKIYADLSFLPFAEKYNCQFVYREFPKDVLSIDGINLLYHFDSVIRLDLGENNSEYIVKKMDEFPIDYRIGGGVWQGSRADVISTPWCTFFWETEPVETQLLKTRKGWSCIMRQNKLHRDMINDLIAMKYSSMFDQHHYYQYDANKNCKYDLTAQMMRRKKPVSKSKSIDGLTPGNLLVCEQQKHMMNNHMHFYLLGPWQDTTLCELVAEASINVFFPTEKTVKPIAAGMPFVEVACCGFLKRLRKMGFRTFHPYIDESYDAIDDWQQRCQTATESFFTFVKNPNHLEKIQEICDHNQKILAKIQTHDRDHRIWKKLRRFIRF